ncbi:MAG: efflux RND transporter periplasmic adaptor subunit [Alphaproteobacteria bacterium]|nr:efflux RND transporter periplasmic adaptor subunit [Alphaproteobacteria bacterium]
MKKTILFLLLLCAAPVPAHAGDAAQETPNVLVSTSVVHQGELPDQVTAYGTAEPLPGGATTISLLRAGQVEKLSVSAGQAVKQGDALLDFISDPAALLAYNQAVAALAAAQKEQTRLQQLVKQRLATSAQLAQADKSVSDAQAALAAAKSQGGDIKTQTLTAPFDGIATRISVGSGDRVSANAPLLQLSHRGGLGVALGLPLEECAGLHVGDVVHLRSLDAKTPPIEGRIAVIAGMIDPQTRLVKILVALPTSAPSGTVQGEQFRAAIERGSFSGVVVPRDTVLKDAKGAYIFQIEDGKAVRVDVHIVGENGGEYAIAGSIDPQEKIVTLGDYELKNGEGVRESSAQ